MTQLRGILIALATIVGWYLLVMATPVIHQAIFAVVPPDGTLTSPERVRVDTEITRYVRYVFPSSGDLPDLKPEEQAHLDDVMMLNGILFLYVFPAILVGLALARFRLTEPLAISWSLSLVVVLGLVTVLGFDGAFSWLHTLLFPQGNWVFPADRYLLTQVYPLGFFIWAWGIILAGAVATLLSVRWFLASKRTVSS